MGPREARAHGCLCFRPVTLALPRDNSFFLPVALAVMGAFGILGGGGGGAAQLLHSGGKT